MKPRGLYARHAADYIAAGIPCFPIHTRDKCPAVKHWKRATVRASRAWAHKFPNADGVGVLLGPPSRLTEVDVESVGDAALGLALERFGESPVTIRTASGKSKIWYRHDDEAQKIKPFPGLAVDLLGAGFTVAPPSWRDDLGAGYRFLTGGLADLERLPKMRQGAAACAGKVAEIIQPGARNNALFVWAMTEARHCDDVTGLIDAAATWAGAMPEPLRAAEIEKTARSAWRYEEMGRNFVGLKRPQVTNKDKSMDMLQDEPDAFFLLCIFERYHSNRGEFMIAPFAMSQAGNPPWHKTRISRARDVLLDRGLLKQVTAPDAHRRKTGLYRLDGTRTESVHNHYTPAPPSFPD